MKAFRKKTSGAGEKGAASNAAIVGDVSKKTRLPVVIGIFVLVVFIGGGTAWFVSQRHETVKKVAAVCQSGQALELSNSLLNSTAAKNTTESTQAIAKMVAFKNYEKDPVCLYSITAYYIQAGDPENGKMYMDKLIAVYDAKVGYVGGPKTEDIDTLRARLAFYEKETADVKNRGVTFGQ